MLLFAPLVGIGFVSGHSDNLTMISKLQLAKQTSQAREKVSSFVRKPAHLEICSHEFFRDILKRIRLV